MRCRFTPLATPVAAFVAVAILGLDADAQTPGIRGFPVPPGMSYTDASSISGDGRFAAGRTGGETYFATRWSTQTGQAINLTPPGPNVYYSEVGGLSYDGSVAFGVSNVGGGIYRWTAASGFTNLSWPVGYNRLGGGGSTSSDGSTMLASFDVWTPQNQFVRRDPFLWREGSGFQPIALPSWGTDVNLAWLDGSGTVASGSIQLNDSSITRAALWRENEGWEALPLPADGAYSYAGRVSTNGRVVSGTYVTNTGQPRGYRWTEETGAVSIPNLPGAGHIQPYALSGDGSVVVGTALLAIGGAPFIWTEQTGTVALADYLTSLGVDTTDWRLSYAWDISDDGTMIVGNGSHRLANGTWAGESYVVTIPAVPTSFAFVPAVALAARRRRHERGTTAGQS